MSSTSDIPVAGTGPGNTAPDAAATFDEYEDRPVPAAARKSLFAVSSVWLGFPMILTCAVFGGMIVYSLGFWPGMAAIAAGNLILMAYVGLLSYQAGRTGENFALMAARTFGAKGYRIPAAFLTTVVIGWFAFQTGLTGSTLEASMGWNATVIALIAGVGYVAATLLGIRALTVIGVIAAPLYLVLGVLAIVDASSASGAGEFTSYAGGAGATALTFGAAVTLVVALFADSGTMTADFTRWSVNGKQAFLAAFSAFPVGNTIALTIGGIIVAMGAGDDPATNGGGFLGILIDNGGVLVPIAIAFVFINLGSVCTHCLYNGAVGWSELTGIKMRVLTVALGAVGVALAVAGIWQHFEDWLNLLGVVVPPLGAVLIVDQVLPRTKRAAPADSPVAWRATSFVAWGGGAVAALVTHYIAPVLCVVAVGILVSGVLAALLSRRSCVPAATAPTSAEDTTSAPV